MELHLQKVFYEQRRSRNESSRRFPAAALSVSRTSRGSVWDVRSVHRSQRGRLRRKQRRRFSKHLSSVFQTVFEQMEAQTVRSASHRPKNSPMPPEFSYVPRAERPCAWETAAAVGNPTTIGLIYREEEEGEEHLLDSPCEMAVNHNLDKLAATSGELRTIICGGGRGSVCGWSLFWSIASRVKGETRWPQHHLSACRAARRCVCEPVV